MAADTPSPSPTPGRPARGAARRFGPVQLPRPLWVYALIAAALLVASEVLWLWHSWPVREILDSERPAAKVSV